MWLGDEMQEYCNRNKEEVERMGPSGMRSVCTTAGDTSLEQTTRS